MWMCTVDDTIINTFCFIIFSNKTNRFHDVVCLITVLRCQNGLRTLVTCSPNSLYMYATFVFFPNHDIICA